jgi:hypothetical protein
MEVYRIFNKINGKSYVGITKWDFKTRYCSGKWYLWTHSTHLKNAVEKFGIDSFDYEILWRGEMPFDQLVELEKLYIKQYDSLVPNGYNLTKGGSSEHPSHVKEYEIADFYGNNYKVKNLSAFCKKNKLNYSGMLNMVSGISQTSQGFFLTCNDVAKINKSPFEVFRFENIFDSSSVSLQRKDISDWCRKLGLKSKPIHNMANKKIKSSQGWKLFGTEVKINEPKIYKFINPKGEIVEVDNIYRFSKENGLERGGFYKLLNGKALSFSGWTLFAEASELQKIKDDRRGKEVELICPDGNIVKIKNISAFCRKKSLNRNSIQALISGKTKKYNGYSLK